ncbi:circadian phase modifier CpmA-like protein [sediment metagenome]|uniref:Circadian phase modifier CpmA-like protein n=1 Tax=sediment metagenome TaxID=749907 RepID=D9PM65_9ZZZZ
MNEENIRRLLERLSLGDISVDDAVTTLRYLPYEDIGFACIDHHRNLRRGHSEVIFGEGKEADDIIAIMNRMAGKQENIMITRISPDKAEKVLKVFPDCIYHKRAGLMILEPCPARISGRGTILVICAGTSDIPVAEEAAITARFMGNEIETVYDVGVSGLHRLMAHRDKMIKASIIIVVAGMEGALPSVVGGLVDKPVIAVPTSVGYGASFKGISALLAMLNSCASGVTVVNIDNGFGAGCAASLMNRK